MIDWLKGLLGYEQINEDEDGLMPSLEVFFFFLTSHSFRLPLVATSLAGLTASFLVVGRSVRSPQRQVVTE